MKLGNVHFFNYSVISGSGECYEESWTCLGTLKKKLEIKNTRDWKMGDKLREWCLVLVPWEICMASRDQKIYCTYCGEMKTLKRHVSHDPSCGESGVTNSLESSCLGGGPFWWETEGLTLGADQKCISFLWVRGRWPSCRCCFLVLRSSRDQLGHITGPTDPINGRKIGYSCKNYLKAEPKYNSEFRDC